MLQSDLITPNNTMSHHQPSPPVLLMDELLLSSTHLMSEAQPSTASYHPPPPPPPPPPAKKKRSLPGHPETDPGAEVIALSPKSLLATNRFMCEICNKGFQRDQNLQLHRRGHNLPWKLKQRAKDEEVRKKVYVCPEAGCVHNDPARALGDLTGIKKHFYRKHGEKKWKCDKCSKKYAVQSDWKAHSKTCGTKEYRCDCGTLFSRRDSFITHRAFCDALVEDTARALTSNPFLPPPQPQQQQQEAAASHHDPRQSPVATSSSPHQNMLFLPNPDDVPQLIQQQQQPHPSESLQTGHIPNLIPPWLEAPPLLQSSSSSPSLLFNHDQLMQSPLQNPSHGPNYPPQPHLSATALLQKAAQLGAIISSNTTSSTSPLPAQPPPPMTDGFGLNLQSSYEHPTQLGFFVQRCGGGGSGGAVVGSSSSSSSLLCDLMMMKSMASFDGDNMPFSNGGINDGLTRDFLGLRPLIHPAQHDIVNLSMTGLGDTNNAASSSSQDRKNEW